MLMKMSMLPVVIVSSALVFGCTGSGSNPDQSDPVESSGYLFVGEPDETVVSPDPNDPAREMTWEFRNLIRVQSFLAESCTKSENPSCRYVLLGYVEYMLDGSIVLEVSMPGVNPDGLRSPASRDMPYQPGCKAVWDPIAEHWGPHPSCSAEFMDEIISASSGLRAKDPAEVTHAEVRAGCGAFVISALACNRAPNPSCLSGLQPQVQKAWDLCTSAHDIITRLNVLIDSYNQHCAPSGRECGPAPGGSGVTCGRCPGKTACNLETGMCECITRWYTKCNPEDGNMWWIDACDNFEDIVTPCPGGCNRDGCISCGATKRPGCHQDDAWELDGCDNPVRRTRICIEGCHEGSCMEDLREECESMLDSGVYNYPMSTGFTCERTFSSTNDLANYVHSHKCMQGKDMSGPEDVYHFFAEKDGTLDVSIQSSANLYLVLLRVTPDDEDVCLEAHPKGIHNSVEKGSCYHLYVDGEQGAQGSYTLKCN